MVTNTRHESRYNHDIAGYTGSNPKPQDVRVKLWQTNLGYIFNSKSLQSSSDPIPKESSHTVKEAAIIWTNTIATGTDKGDISVYTLEFGGNNDVWLELT
jgi:hypothetical protein